MISCKYYYEEIIYRVLLFFICKLNLDENRGIIWERVMKFFCSWRVIYIGLFVLGFRCFKSSKMRIFLI